MKKTLIIILFLLLFTSVAQADNTIRADVNNSGKISVLDASLTMRKILNNDLSGTNWVDTATTGDVNCDNQINQTDAQLLFRYSLGLPVDDNGWCDNNFPDLTQEVQWFLGQHEDLKNDYFVGKFGVDDHPSGWDHGAYMRAYIDMYEASYDVRLLRKLDELLEIVADGNDILTNRIDDRTGTVLPGWGFRESFGQDGQARYSEMLANALYAYPLAAFARIVKEDPNLQPEFGAHADRYYDMVEQLYSIQNPFVNDGDSPYGDGTTGTYYQYPNGHIEDSLDYSNREAPINLTVIIAEPLVEMYRASIADGHANDTYRDIVTQVGNYIWWNTTQQTSGQNDHFLTWYYWPADVDPNSQDRMEDVNHGARLAEFVFSLYDAGLRNQWTEEKLQYLANTFTSGAVIDPNNITFSNYIDGSGGVYNDDAATLYEWLELQEYSHSSSRESILHYIRTAMQNQGDDEQYNIAVFAKFARFSRY